jgi:hypothetical protein
MSLNPVPMDSAEESFARLLEHLTSRSEPRTPVADSGPDVASPTGSVSISKSISTSGLRSATRSLLPLTEVTDGRASGIPDSTPLSYEKALRLHTRRTTTPNTSRDLPELPLPANAPRRDGAARKSATPNIRARNEAQAQPRTKPSAKSSPQAQSRSNSQSKKSSVDRQPFKGSQGPAHAAQPRKGRKLAKLERHDLQWNPIGAIEQSGQAVRQLNQLAPFDQPAQRRSTVSLRLTDNELLQLKDRACESGISVSAYMRSCIVDADQLRAQVKQALAEMRAANARPEPNRFPALLPPESTSSDRGGHWLRLLARSAVFLFSPFFPFRRGA